MPTLRTLLPVVAAMLPVVQGFGGGKSTVFIPCNSDNDPSKTTVLQKIVTELMPLDSLILNASCSWSTLQLQSYTNIIVDINGGSPGNADMQLISQL